MEDKKADNRIFDSRTENRQKIGAIDTHLDNERQKLRKLDEMEELAISINKKMDRCLDLLSKSIAGPNTENAIADMRHTNKEFLNKTSSSIEKSMNQARKRINGLYKEKEKLISEERNKIASKKEQKEE